MNLSMIIYGFAIGIVLCLELFLIQIDMKYFLEHQDDIDFLEGDKIED